MVAPAAPFIPTLVAAAQTLMSGLRWLLLHSTLPVIVFLDADLIPVNSPHRALVHGGDSAIAGLCNADSARALGRDSRLARGAHGMT